MIILEWLSLSPATNSDNSDNYFLFKYTSTSETEFSIVSIQEEKEKKKHRGMQVRQGH